MKTERQLAEQIFDSFRVSNCRSGQIVPMRTIRFGVMDKLNLKEKDVFMTVLNGLIFTGYYSYEKDGLESLRLTEKGYDYIYDESKVKLMLNKPWVIPSTENTDWDKAYFKLWKIIGPQDSAPHYIGGSKFYKFIMDLCDDIPPSYSNYIEYRRDKELSTSRVDYYKDLINHLDDEKRLEFYVNVQMVLEENSEPEENQNDDLNLNNTPSLQSSSIEKSETENLETNKVNQDVPNVFVSYSWDNKKHEEWVLNLATKLCENGVNAILDKWDLGDLGKPLPHFMENSIAISKRVICIMTPNYKKKTDKLQGGVGYEYSIITSQIFSDIKTSKFIPLIRSGNDNDSIPIALAGRKYVDMRKDDEFEEKFIHELLRDIHNEPKYKKPAIGKKPTFD